MWQKIIHMPPVFLTHIVYGKLEIFTCCLNILYCFQDAEYLETQKVLRLYEHASMMHEVITLSSIFSRFTFLSDSPSTLFLLQDRVGHFRRETLTLASQLSTVSAVF